MNNKEQYFYITTPIYYVTARPHLGTLYSTLLADVITRWQRLQGKKTFFLTGTDEHGQKVAQAAQQASMAPKAFVDSFVGAYKTMWQQYELAYDWFVRTTDTYHVRAVQEWIIRLQKQGDIYKSFYEGWYCTPCETYVLEKDATHISDKEPACSSCGRSTTLVAEEAYFFRLSAYQEPLLEFYHTHADFIVPKERMAEVVNFVRSGLKDLSISRTTVTWGIPFPGDNKHVTYVWADALNNYISAVGFAQEGRAEEFAQWWPADVHVLGKDILRFHAVYWPAFLMASNLALPKRLLVHGWIQVDKQKMSKSLGNVVDPQKLYEMYGADPVRYYLMRQMAVTHDGDFSITDLEARIASDLANDLGNLLNRMLMLAHKHGVVSVGRVSVWSSQALALRDEAETMLDDVKMYMNDYLIHMALARIWKFISMVNAYFHAQEPWKLARTHVQEFLQVLAATCHSLRLIALVTWPVMPKKMEDMLAALGVPFESSLSIDHETFSVWEHDFVLHQSSVLFKKPELTEPLKESPVTKPQEAAVLPLITIDDFSKVALLVGTIVVCELLPQSEKLYRMEVDFGDKGVRQILAGIRLFHASESLVGTQGIFVFNLAPRVMLGLESQGMLLTAKDASGIPQLVRVPVPVPNGTRLS